MRVIQRAQNGQRLVSPKKWIGSESVNLFQVVCETLDSIEIIAAHVQGTGPIPTTAAVVHEGSGAALTLSTTLREVV